MVKKLIFINSILLFILIITSLSNTNEIEELQFHVIPFILQTSKTNKARLEASGTDTVSVKVRCSCEFVGVRPSTVVFDSDFGFRFPGFWISFILHS